MLWIILDNELRRQISWKRNLNTFLNKLMLIRALRTCYSTHFIGFGADVKWNSRAEVHVWGRNSRGRVEGELLQETREEEEELHFCKSLTSADPPSWNKMQKCHKESVGAASSIVGRNKNLWAALILRKISGNPEHLKCHILAINKEYSSS